MAEPFTLDSRLARDSSRVGDFALSELRLIHHRDYPWLILVPRINGAQEIIDLSQQQQQLLWQESARVSHGLKALFGAEKLNVAAIGNVVSQLHLHHVARYQHDPDWPGPVWGRPMKAYTSTELNARMEKIRVYFQQHGGIA